MASSEELLELARREIGTKEKPAGSNCVKYNTAYMAGRCPAMPIRGAVCFYGGCFNPAVRRNCFTAAPGRPAAER